MDPGALVEGLRLWNPQWTSGKPAPDVRRFPLPRRGFRYLYERIHEPPYEMIAGPRQVGKTTLLGHLIGRLLDDGHPAEHVVYVPLDAPPIVAQLDEGLQGLLSVYEQAILGTAIVNADLPVYLLLDELHTLPNWSSELKGLYDRYSSHARVVATGSSSAALLNPPTADLPGRAVMHHLYPLKFSEFVEMLMPGGFERDGPVMKAARAARDSLAEADPSSPDTTSATARALEALYRLCHPHRVEIQAAFEQYLVRGGYPQAAGTNEERERIRFHETTIDTMMAKDLGAAAKVRKPRQFRAFLAQLAISHAGKFVASNFSDRLGLDKETPAHWKEAAEDVFLVRQLPALNRSRAIVFNKADKCYIQDPGIRAYLTGEGQIATLESSGKIGIVVEGVLYDHLRRLQFNTLGHRSGTLGYWAQPELDFVVELPASWLLVESKYGPRPREPRSLREARQENQEAIAWLVSRSDFDVTSDIWRLPAWFVCLLA